jgi:hypothetical protein
VPEAELQLPEDVVTSTQTVVVSEVLPEAPVTLISYAPVVVVDVVAAVSVEVCADELLKVSDVGERLQVVGLIAPEGDVVMAQESETVPVNVLDGVTVMVEVLPEVAPGLTEMLPLLLRLKSVLPLPPPGACQKSPHPARSGAAANNSLAHVPIFISAPSLPRTAFWNKG